MSTTDELFNLLSCALRDADAARVCASVGFGDWMPGGVCEAFRVAAASAEDTGKPAFAVYGLAAVEMLPEADQDRMIASIGGRVACPKREFVADVFARARKVELIARLERCDGAEQLRALCASAAQQTNEGTPVFAPTGGTPRQLVKASFAARPARMLEGLLSPAVAEILEGAITRDSLTAFAGPAKIGKSGLLVFIAMLLAKAGYRTKYLTLGDDGEGAIARRVLRALVRRPLVGDWAANRVRTRSYHICDTAARGECSDCPKDAVLDPYPTEKLLRSQNGFSSVVTGYGCVGVCPKAATCPKYKPRPWWVFEKPLQAVEEAAFGDLPAWTDNLIIRYAEKGKCSVADVEREIEDCDAGIIDYADMLKFCSEKEADHEQFRGTWEDLRNLSHRKNKALVTATQANRSGAGAQSQSVQTLGRTKTVADNATCVVGINQTDAEKTRKILRINDIVAREFDYSTERNAEICIDAPSGVWLEGESRTVWVYEDGQQRK